MFAVIRWLAVRGTSRRRKLNSFAQIVVVPIGSSEMTLHYGWPQKLGEFIPDKILRFCSLKYFGVFGFHFLLHVRRCCSMHHCHERETQTVDPHFFLFEFGIARRFPSCKMLILFSTKMQPLVSGASLGNTFLGPNRLMVKTISCNRVVNNFTISLNSSLNGFRIRSELRSLIK